MELIQEQTRIGWVRLSTLVNLRWFAILGQALAVVVATQVYGLQLHTGLLLAVVGVAVLVNLISTAIVPQHERSPGRFVAASMLFDVVQIDLLLMLSGGLNNPFAMLMLAPLTISAAVLSRRGYRVVAAAGVLGICVMVPLHLPLVGSDGQVIDLPWLVEMGLFLSLVIGVAFFGLYARRLSTEYQQVFTALDATQRALAREQKMAAIGGLAAAAAHEMGTPLSTITLTAAELAREYGDQPDLAEDIALIRSQADRCRDILHRLGDAKDQAGHIAAIPLQGIIEEALHPHDERGTPVDLNIRGTGPQPAVQRRPELIHALRNILQNAVDHAASRVAVEMHWTDTEIRVRIRDDGPGFPPDILSRMGEPSAPGVRARRGGRQGMGLGLFIARTLLRRVGARLRLANGTGPRRGAVAEITWPVDTDQRPYQSDQP